MKIITSSPLQAESVSSPTRRARTRTSLMFAAFWHTFRRDVMVTFREFIPFLVQVLVQPVSLLLVFGRVLPGMGTMQQVYPSSFLPAVIALTIFVASLLGITLTLMLDLDYGREIDDRLLAPMPVSMVAVEKVVFSALRSLVAGAIVFFLAHWILGPGYQVRGDSIGLLIAIMVLYALSSSALGLVIGAALPAEKIYMLFSLVLSATLYTGCVYYTWSSLSAYKVFQILTLLNPLTYAAEGLRDAMMPYVNGQAFATLPIVWALVGLIGSFVIFLTIGIKIFHKRVIS
jgi:ABC-2 type transport system permease protein